MSKERWRPVDGYPLHEVSDHGRVKFLAHTVTFTDRRGRFTTRHYPERILKNAVTGFGYLQVELRNEGVAKVELVHRLVAKAFIKQSSPEKTWVLHKDDNPANAFYKNLRWGTPQDNVDDRTERDRASRGSKHGRAVLTESNVRKIAKLIHSGIGNRHIGQLYAVHETTIRDLRAGRSWSHVTGFGG